MNIDNRISVLVSAFRVFRIAGVLTLLSLSLPASASAQAGTKGFLYVAISNQGLIKVIDTETFSVIHTIDVGGWPSGVEMSPDGTRAYVAHRFRSPAELDKPSKASVIDVATSTVIMELETGRYGFDAAVSRDGLLAFISDRDIDLDGSISVINTETFEVTTLTHPDKLGFPSGMFVSYDNAQLNIANQVDSTIAGMSLPDFPLFKFPVGIRGTFDVTTSANAVYATGSDPDGNIVKLGFGGTITIATGTTMAGIIALPNYKALYAVRSVRPGEVYVVDLGSDTVSNTIVTCDNPWGIAASEDSEFVYVTCNATGEVKEISTLTNTVVRTVEVGGSPLGISFNSGPAAGTSTTDSGNACCYLEAGTWSDVSDGSSSGPTPARLNETGSGEDHVSWRFPNIRPGRYEVSAWWVPGADRANNTPFSVYQNGVAKHIAPIRVDQSDPATANRWNVLGTFDLSPGDSVVVSDDAVGTTNPSFVVADAIRLLDTAETGTANEPVPTEIPGNFRLNQNYPNPFNPRTTISYAIDQPGHVDLRVYNILGELVQTLVSQKQTAGSFFEHFDASDLPSGVYYYRLSFEGSTSTQKMVLLK